MPRRAKRRYVAPGSSAPCVLRHPKKVPQAATSQKIQECSPRPQIESDNQAHPSSSPPCPLCRTPRMLEDMGSLPPPPCYQCPAQRHRQNHAIHHARPIRTVPISFLFLFRHRLPCRRYLFALLFNPRLCCQNGLFPPLIECSPVFCLSHGFCLLVEKSSSCPWSPHRLRFPQCLIPNHDHSPPPRLPERSESIRRVRKQIVLRAFPKIHPRAGIFRVAF